MAALNQTPKTIVNGQIVTPDGICHGTLLIEQGKIQEIRKEGQASESVQAARETGEVIDAQGNWVVPGFIDVHVHGAAGYDFTDEHPGAIEEVCRFHAAHGTTSLLPTVRTQSNESILASLTRVGQAVNLAYTKLQAGELHGALPLGIHLEGPFLSKAHRGAQREEFLQTPSLAKMKAWHEAADGKLKLVTLAPELDGAAEVIRWLVQQGIAVSAGHSGAAYEEMQEGIAQGVQHMTHFYNGMRAFNHRDPGLLAAGWLEDEVSVEVIYDGHHVHDAAIALLLKLKSPDKILLVTDAVRPAGLPDGELVQEDGPSLFVKDGIVRLASGTLAGSTLTMNQAFCHLIYRLGVPVDKAVRLASEAPAKLTGSWPHKGSIELGKDADLVILSPTGEVQHTICEGQVIYKRGQEHH